MQATDTLVDLSGLAPQEIDALEIEAKKRGLSLEDACKQLLIEHARELRKRPRLTRLGRLLRFPIANQK